MTPNESGKSTEALINALSTLMKDLLVFLPHQVVEMYPDAIAPPQYSLGDDEEEEEAETTSEESEEGSDEEEEAEA
ncbi:hypothetical protein, conserved [Angomonas deanei]|uniref:Uncharacterized protein n=1 Tax=Angomonas deanei TaxID=59799 RepID=A0A7G2CDM4_9TRYP|nr:hypothetical protein, conserved [Angomonas deanei]